MLVLVLLGAILSGCQLFMLSGCQLFNGPTPTTPEEVLEHTYTTEVVACAATAGYPGAYDREADMRCRAAVDCRYGLGPCS